MRFMVLLKADKDTEAGALPDEKLLTDMMKYNEDMAKAGVLLAGEGLQPSSKGARVIFSGKKRTVIDGPFAETKELIAGFWMIKVKSKAEAIEWIKRCPNPLRGEAQIEIRQVFEAADFGEELTPELKKAEKRVAEQAVRNAKR
jgi:hypothetical protein